jgi:hypothetical protein
VMHCLHVLSSIFIPHSRLCTEVIREKELQRDAKDFMLDIKSSASSGSALFFFRLLLVYALIALSNIAVIQLGQAFVRRTA